MRLHAGSSIVSLKKRDDVLGSLRGAMLRLISSPGAACSSSAWRRRSSGEVTFPRGRHQSQSCSLELRGAEQVLRPRNSFIAALALRIQGELPGVGGCTRSSSTVRDLREGRNVGRLRSFVELSATSCKRQHAR